MTNDTPRTRTATTWEPDTLGDGYEQHTIELGPDPDGEGEAVATLVRHTPPAGAPGATGAPVIWVHGYTDYFFHQHVAEHFADRGQPFYALDLRKCGRSRRPGQSAHFVTDLALYDAELEETLRIVRAETGRDAIFLAHSTGGLVVALWLDRRGTADGVAAVVLNSPWIDLQGPAYYRSVLTPIVDVAGRFLRFTVVPNTELSTYGDSIHSSRSGEWDYDLDWKPLSGFPARLGWLRAIRRGQAQLHRGLSIGVPALVLRSRRSKFARAYSPEIDSADAVVDVAHIQRWAGCFGDRTDVVPIEGARHDVFLSTAPVRRTAFEEMDTWLDRLPEAGA